MLTLRIWSALALSSLAIAGCSTSGVPREEATPSASAEVSADPSPVSTPSGIFVVDCMEYVEAPKELQLYCADGGQQLSKIMWASWTKESAFALATSTKNTCNPDCASGNYDVRTASLLLSDLVTSPDGHQVFSRVSIKYDKPLSDGQSEEVVELPTEPMP